MLNNQLAPASALSQGAQQNLKGMQAMGQGGQYLQQGAKGLQQGQQDYANNIMNAWNLGNNMIGNAYGAGQKVEDYQGRALQDAMQRHAYQYSEPYGRMELAQGIANSLAPLGTSYNAYKGMSSGQTSGMSQQPNPNYQSMGQAILGGMGTGAQIGGMLQASDRRLKTNIERIGTTPAGYPWYRFDYVWGEPGEGVMSDEVPPAWVRKHPSGYDMVDYGKVR
jgi:hypothetical protein